MAPITFEKLTKRFDDLTAVDALDIDVPDGEFLVLVGPSGCGKTTALRMLAGLEEVTSGRILIGDRVVNTLAPGARDVAMVFQSYALYPHMTVFANLAFSLQNRHLPKPEIERRVRAAAEVLELEGLLTRRPKQLSGGQRQRVALGRAIVREPAVFLMDEPLSNLDAALRVQTRAEILKLQRRLGTTTIYVTHDHPDHFFSVEVITDAFPQARVIAAPQVVDDIWKSIPLKLKRWGPMLGANGPRHPIAPVALEADHFELEGHRLEIIGPMQGDHTHATAVWIPDARALIAGDLLFNEMHLWFGESLQPARQAWGRSVERLAALGATTVVAGHKKPGLPDDVSAIAYTRRYLDEFEKDVAGSKGSAELAAKIRAAFPQTIDVFGDFLLGTSSKVAMGEIPPWQE